MPRISSSTVYKTRYTLALDTSLICKSLCAKGTMVLGRLSPRSRKPYPRCRQLAPDSAYQVISGGKEKGVPSCSHQCGFVGAGRDPFVLPRASRFGKRRPGGDGAFCAQFFVD